MGSVVVWVFFFGGGLMLREQPCKMLLRDLAERPNPSDKGRGSKSLVAIGFLSPALLASTAQSDGRWARGFGQAVSNQGGFFWRQLE